MSAQKRKYPPPLDTEYAVAVKMAVSPSCAGGAGVMRSFNCLMTGVCPWKAKRASEYGSDVTPIPADSTSHEHIMPRDMVFPW